MSARAGRGRAGALAAAALLGVWGAALATPAARAAEDAGAEDPVDARYEAAKQALDARRYEEALAGFLTGLELAEDDVAAWRMLLGAAVTCEEMGRPVEAIGWYRAFLARSVGRAAADTDKWRGRREAARGVIARLEEAVLATHGRVYVESDPPGASVRLAGVAGEAPATPAWLYLRPGRHVVVLEAPRHARATRELELEAGARRTLTVTLEPLPADPPPQLRTAAHPAGGGPAPEVWAPLAAGGALAVAGTVCLVLALGEHGPAAQRYYDAHREAMQQGDAAARGRYASLVDTAEGWYTAGWVLYGVGAVAVGTGLYFALRSDDAAPATPPAAGLRLDLQPLPGGAIARARLRF